MARTIWSGTLLNRLKIASGLVLFSYAFFHFFNIGLGLISVEAMEAMQTGRQLISRSWPGTILLYGALLIHGGLALWRLAGRRTLKMPPWEAVQLGLGLLIPLLLGVHITYTRVAHEAFGVNDRMGFLIGLIFDTRSGWQQALLLLIVWTHGCIGLHFWLRQASLWNRLRGGLLALAVLLPGFALAGFLTEGRRQAALWSDPEAWPDLAAFYNFPTPETFAALIRIDTLQARVVWALIALSFGTYLLRRVLRGRQALRVTYVDGPEVTGTPGATLLEISRANGVAHTALCGGRGRCTTCRVVIEAGTENLPPPSEAEAKSLRAVGAAPGTRLACQLRPTAPVTVYRVFREDGKRRRAHSSQGRERRMAILFLDIRGFTSRTAGQLPYDVVFLLNRFFDAIVPEITKPGGVVDKYLGDGLLALFEAEDEAASARAALRAAAGIGAALEQFNAALTREGAEPVRIGIGLHLGDLVLGEIGAAGNAPRTIIGETVNAASRLESCTKDMGVQALISAPVLSGAGVDLETLDLIDLDLRGVRRPVPALALTEVSAVADLL